MMDRKDYFTEGDVTRLEQVLGVLANAADVSWEWHGLRELVVCGLTAEPVTFTHPRPALAYLEGFGDGYDAGFGDGNRYRDEDGDREFLGQRA